jgi:transcriptional regulator with PAS, ATPase and Fis domain
LSESLIESELFGHERGAFTGAVEVKKGVFEMANGGTLILDEIGDMPLHLQTKLLTVLDENKLRRIGGSRDIQLNLKIIATTNIDLEAALVHGRFRQDLYYRLSTFHIHIPPLRERPADIPGLCSVIFRQLARKDIFLSQDQISALELYPWPGNVRELKNVLERALILSSGGDVRPGDLINHHPHSMTTNGKPAIPGGIAAKPLRLADIEVQYTLGVLDSNGGNKTLTAKQLGVSINTLKRILQRSGRRAVHVRRMERAVRPSEEM